MRVAIACQGGGSHTAFTAGVLKRLLWADGHEVVASSGTSGGAVCAYLAWHGLSSPGGSALAVDLLDRFWSGNAASAPWDAALNWWLVNVNRLEGTVALPAVSPYCYPPIAQEQFRAALERLVPDGSTPDRGPLLLVGAVDVCSGGFKAFSSARGEVGADAVLASAAIPNLFRAVHLGGAAYWDGLFSQNPPVRELPDAGPDAIWVVQINPAARRWEPTTVAAILDRRNELAGNLSLSQELGFIEKVNELVGKGWLKGSKYRHIQVETIALDWDLDTASKLDRSPDFIASLMTHGERKADEFLAARRG